MHMGLTSPLFSHGRIHNIWIRTHKGLGLSMVCLCIGIDIGIYYFPPSCAKSYKYTNTDPYTLLFTEFVYVCVCVLGLDNACPNYMDDLLSWWQDIKIY